MATQALTRAGVVAGDQTQVLRKWREQIARVAQASDALAVELRGLCAIYGEADVADEGKLEPFGLGLPSRFVTLFLGGADIEGGSGLALWKAECVKRGWLRE